MEKFMWTSGFVWLPLLAMETRKHINVTYYEDFWLSGGKMILPENQKCEVDSECCFKGWGLSAKLGKHSAIWGKLGTAIQGYILNPCTKFPPNPTSRKVNT